MKAKPTTQYNTYLNKTHKRGDGGELQIGDTVRVHPSAKGETEKSYIAEIVIENMTYCSKFQKVICSGIQVINEYLFDRLELIKAA